MLGLLGLTLTLVLVRAAVAGGGNAPVPTVVATGFAWAENILCEPSVGDVRGTALCGCPSRRGESCGESLTTRVAAAGRRRSTTCGRPARRGVSSGSFGRRRVRAGATRVWELRAHAHQQNPNRHGDKGRGAAQKVSRLTALSVDNRTQTFFAANEGDFLPYNGKVYSIDRRTGTVEEIAKDGGPYTSTDGAAYDAVTGQLFVSEVYASALLRDRPARKTEKLKAPKGVEGIDDFCVAEDDTNLIHGASPPQR